MTRTEVSPFEQAVQTSNTWINQLMEKLEWHDRHRTYKALRVVLHALRDRLPMQEVVDLGAQLPMMIRGLYYEGWKPGASAPKVRKKEEFLLPIEEAFRDDPDIFPEAVAWGVFRLLADHVSRGEISARRNQRRPSRPSDRSALALALKVRHGLPVYLRARTWSARDESDQRPGTLVIF
jgi:uncharacterized protein (DUF2267 family)